MKQRREPLSPRSAGPPKTEAKGGSASRRAATATAAQPAAPLLGAITGRLVAGGTATQPLVDFEGNLAGAIRARTTIALDPAILDRAIATKQAAVLYFENGDPTRPIVVGLIQNEKPQTALQELLLAPRAAAHDGTARSGDRAREEPASPDTGGSPPAVKKNDVEARLDGERVVLEGAREVTLKCGEASITLRRDGKIVLRGVYVETYARGVNRIKGGAVKIN